MKRLYFVFVILLVAMQQVSGQVPQLFSYQAVLRNADGTVIANQAVNIRITLHKTTAGGTVVYTETESPTTNGQGIVNLTIGDGTPATFATIPWLENIFIQIEVKKSSDANYVDMGTSQILSVPYSLYALSAGSVKEVASPTSAGPDDPIFVVKNKDGKIVFAVYQTGVRVYVEDSPTTKGAKGGFAVGGLSNQAKSGGTEYFRITSDSARIYINDLPGKGAKGGFAVGGLSNQAKSGSPEYLRITTDSARINFNESSSKGAKGGFAVGGLSNQAKSNNQNYLVVNKDTTFFNTTLTTTADIVTTGSVSYGGLAKPDPNLVGTIKDVDGNVYYIVTIGNNVWMKENLRTTHYNDNTLLQNTEVVTYKNSTNADTIKNFGRLYTSSVAYNQDKNVCPDGWHVPTEIEWNDLLVAVGGGDWMATGNMNTALSLMETGTSATTGFWNISENLATNSSGFSARPGGSAQPPYMSMPWMFNNIGIMGSWWGIQYIGMMTKINISSDGSTYSVMKQGSMPVAQYGGDAALSIRCVKGNPMPIIPSK